MVSPATSSKPRTSTRASSAVVDEATQTTALAEAIEHAAKPWSVDSQPAHVRAAVAEVVGKVEALMSTMTHGKNPVRPLQAVQQVVERAWLMGFHTGRAYETALDKVRREQRKQAKAETSQVTRRQGVPKAKAGEQIVNTSKGPVATPIAPQ